MSHSVAAAPSEPSASQNPDIVVRAQEQRKLWRGFVDLMTQAGPTDQLGRWNREICPRIDGLGPRQAELIDRRITQIARTVDLRRGSARCRPSLIVFFTNRPTELVDAVAKAYPVTLRTDGNLPLNRFLKSDKPVRWLSVTDPCGHGCVLTGSHIRKGTTPAFRMMLIVVDGTQIGKYQLSEMADYLALVALTNPPQDNAVPPSSILSMFDEPQSTQGVHVLTPRDQSFLTALYASDVDVSAGFQRLSIARRMRKQLGDNK